MTDIFTTQWGDIEPGDGRDQARELPNGGYIIATSTAWRLHDTDDRVLASGDAHHIIEARIRAEEAALAYYSDTPTGEQLRVSDVS